MSLTPQEITLDLNPSFSQMQTVHCSQYDDKIRQIIVKLKDGGTNIDVSSYTIYIEGTKPDKHGFSYPLTEIGSVSGNTVTFYIQLQMCAVPGMTRAEVVLKSGDDRIGSANFMLAVERAGLQDDTNTSDSELAPYIDGAQSAMRSADTAAGNAEDSAEDAEAWAVGKRNGQDVGESDETYHNNSKYYKEQVDNALSDVESDITDLQGRVTTLEGEMDTVQEDTSDLKSAFEEFPTGIYPDMTVGSLMSEEYTEEKMPYLYRVSGGGVEVGKVEADTIVGGTVAWNQLVQYGDFAGTTGWSVTNGTMSIQDNVLTAVGTSDATPYLTTYYINKVANHKYFFAIDVFPQETMSAFAILSPFAFRKENVAGNTWSTLAGIVNYTGTTGSTNLPYYFNYNGANNGKTTKFRNNMIIDLTQMFGATIADYIYSLETATAGAGVAVFRKLFPNSYYPYNAGELLSVSGLQSHDMVGFNQWDEEWANGIWNSTGVFTPDLDQASIACKNKIKVLPNTDYYFTIPSYIPRLIIRTYDSAENFKTTLFVNSSGTFTTPTDCYYITLCTYVADNVSAYTGGLCFNLSWSGARNGEYEPYVKHSYPLDSSLTLRGIPKVEDGKMYYDGDVYSADGKVQRKYGIITYDGSTDEAWRINSEGSTTFYIENSYLKKVADYRGEIICDKLVTTQSHGYMTGDYIISGYNDRNNQYPNQNWIYIQVNSSITDIGTLKTWLQSNPITLVYELATPTTETAEPYEEYQHVTNGGTEEYVSTGIVPVGHITKYYGDIVSKVDKLPSDFSNIIAPTESAFKATRAYTVNELIIIDNVLYKVTASIASGATITPNTNVQQTTLSALIKALS